MEPKKTDKVNDKNITGKAIKKEKGKVSTNDAFKKKYFEYYDDVKISYKEDW